ncbi:MAG: hypothetical protein IT539_05940 [Bradyrhizobiaceae bacterium]|nr:hypothetical protein [Bradyrhizobiaceae bacterium]
MKIAEIAPDLVSRLEASIGDRVYKATALKIRTKVLDTRNDPDTAGAAGVRANPERT